jgi:hypothetical protein
VLLLLLVGPTASSDWKPKIDESSSSELFSIVPDIEVLAPTQFPKPTRLLNDTSVVTIVEPTFGQHRPENDVVMAYAEGYSLPYYISFVGSLRKTGFSGDIVLAIAHYPLLEKNVVEYLKRQENLVVYIHELH